MAIAHAEVAFVWENGFTNPEENFHTAGKNRKAPFRLNKDVPDFYKSFIFSIQTAWNLRILPKVTLLSYYTKGLRIYL